MTDPFVMKAFITIVVIALGLWLVIHHRIAKEKEAEKSAPKS